MGIAVVAYSPFLAPAAKLNPDKTDLLAEPVVKELGEKYKKTPAQILVNWSLARGHVVIPKSQSKERQKLNLESYKFKMEEADVKKLSGLARGMRNFKMELIDAFGNVPLFD